MQTVISIKWGDRYGPEYVNRLYNMVMRNTYKPTRFVCFTDDATGVYPEIEIKPLPPINLPERVMNRPWRKVSLWQAPLSDLTGDILYLDLDLVITGNIDDFFTYQPGKFAVIRNWTQPGLSIGNTSVYRFTVGQHKFIFDQFNADPEPWLRRYGISQKYVSDQIKDRVFWPRDWCLSFKHSLIPPWPMRFFKTPKLPRDARVVAFTGKPDPEDAVVGSWPNKNFIKCSYKFVKPTPWIAEPWR